MLQEGRQALSVSGTRLGQTGPRRRLVQVVRQRGKGRAETDRKEGRIGWMDVP